MRDKIWTTVGRLALAIMLLIPTQLATASAKEAPNALGPGICLQCQTIGPGSAPGTYELDWGPGCSGSSDKTGCAYCLGDHTECAPDQNFDWTGPCDVPCPQARGEELDLDAGNVESILAALRENPESVEFNERRGAIQLFSCKGQVVRSTPLSDEVLTALRRAVAP